ncbi:MAG: sigma-54-dependent Fis family transcriptional regulator [Pseudomonadota bacterium]|nr:MAG: sigma-54-dependent Fis family transcriptional regulator [Pseudomonadota bacterium]
MQPHEAQVTGDTAIEAGFRAPFILVVDDEPDIRELVREILEDEGYEVATAENGAAAQQAHRARRADLVLLDIWMPDIDGITLLKQWSVDGQLPMPVIMISGHGTVETAVEATRLGAYDFIEKPLSLAKLLLTVEHALEADKLQRENLGLRHSAHLVNEPGGKSALMQRLKEQIKRIAAHDTPVLINGEAGSGLHVAARYLHACSPQHDMPFIDANATALSGDTTGSELFGSEDAGAKVHYGLLEQAAGGTLFLCDIADLEPAIQARLLSTLESKQFQRAGGSESVPLNTRIVAATYQDLEQRVRDARFRKDLFYRLNVVPIEVPALREHREDVPELLAFYADYYVDQEKLPYRRFTVAAQNRLRNYHWPGNIRELKNLVQRLLIVGVGDEITLEEIETALGAAGPEPSAAVIPSAGFELPLREARERFERAYFEYHLEKTGGSVGKVASLSGLERTHLYRKLKSLGIDAKQKARER